MLQGVPRPQLALYAAGAIVVVLLGARYLASQGSSGAGPGAPAGAAGGSGAAGTAPGAAAGAAGPGGAGPPVDINTAGPEELDQLDGVGPATAQKILAYRQAHGGFRSVQELDQVPGIGPKKLAALKDRVRV